MLISIICLIFAFLFIYQFFRSEMKDTYDHIFLVLGILLAMVAVYLMLSGGVFYFFDGSHRP